MLQLQKGLLKDMAAHYELAHVNDHRTTLRNPDYGEYEKLFSERFGFGYPDDVRKDNEDIDRFKAATGARETLTALIVGDWDEPEDEEDPDGLEDMIEPDEWERMHRRMIEDELARVFGEDRDDGEEPPEEIGTSSKPDGSVASASLRKRRGNPVRSRATRTGLQATRRALEVSPYLFEPSSILGPFSCDYEGIAIISRCARL